MTNENKAPKLIDKDKVIAKLREAFLDKNVECDGPSCTGCWKDVIREAIKMLEVPLEQVEQGAAKAAEKQAEIFGVDGGKIPVAFIEWTIKERWGSISYGDQPLKWRQAGSDFSIPYISTHELYSIFLTNTATNGTGI